MTGAALGLVFGFLASRGDPEAVAGPGATPDGVFLGYVLAFSVGGVIIGAALPLFRSRFLAFLVVWVGSGVGVLLLFDVPVGGFDPDDWFMIVFIGFAYGFIYARLFWDYRGEKGVVLNGVSSGMANERERVREREDGDVR